MNMFLVSVYEPPLLIRGPKLCLGAFLQKKSDAHNDVLEICSLQIILLPFYEWSDIQSIGSLLTDLLVHRKRRILG